AKIFRRSHQTIPEVCTLAGPAQPPARRPNDSYCERGQPRCRRITLIAFYLIGAILRGILGRYLERAREDSKLRGISRDSITVFWREAALCRPGGGDHERGHCRHWVLLRAGRMFCSDAEPGFHEVGSAVRDAGY